MTSKRAETRNSTTKVNVCEAVPVVFRVVYRIVWSCRAVRISPMARFTVEQQTLFVFVPMGRFGGEGVVIGVFTGDSGPSGYSALTT